MPDISLSQLTKPTNLPQPRGMFATQRRDQWWAMPLAIAAGLVFFLIYGTIMAFQQNHYFFHGPQGQNYLSPFFSPLFYDTKSTLEAGKSSTHAWFGGWQPGWWPALVAFAPTMLILWAPGAFRFTCYGFRGHYYKGLWADPIACGVGEPGFRGGAYRGEKKFPLTIQNLHRYFLYVIIVLLAIKCYDTYKTLFVFNTPANPDPKNVSLGFGLGTFILLIEPILLAMYVGGCHSLRHLIGGRKDAMGSTGVQKKAYDCVSCLNKRHMLWGWASLLWIIFADMYVRALSLGWISDPFFFKI